MNELPDEKIFVGLLDAIVMQNDGCSLRKAMDSSKAFLELDGIEGMQLERPCLFQSCDNVEVAVLLKGFLDNRCEFGFNLSCQLSRLLVLKGSLCKSEVETIINSTDWRRFDSHFFVLSYVAKMDIKEIMLPRLLDDVPEDFRDGLFLAFYLSEETTIQDSLIRHFLLWSRDGGWTPNSTGELHWLAVFIKKWCGMYPYAKLEAIVKLYFEHV